MLDKLIAEMYERKDDDPTVPVRTFDETKLENPTNLSVSKSDLDKLRANYRKDILQQNNVINQLYQKIKELERRLVMAEDELDTKVTLRGEL